MTERRENLGVFPAGGRNYCPDRHNGIRGLHQPDQCGGCLVSEPDRGMQLTSHSRTAKVKTAWIDTSRPACIYLRNLLSARTALHFTWYNVAFCLFSFGIFVSHHNADVSTSYTDKRSIL
jgi:hypothetical protein